MCVHCDSQDDSTADDARSPNVATRHQAVERRYSRRSHRLATDGYGWLQFGSKSPDYRFDTVLDFVAPLAALVSLTTLAEGALAGCRKAAWAAANRAIGTRNGLQLT